MARFHSTPEGLIPYTEQEELQSDADDAKAIADRNLNSHKEKRALEYPDFKDYLDGIVKGDQAQIQAYIDACLAVKAKYPKP